MIPFVQDSDFTLLVGDVRECLRELPDESVHTVVTSPPYWGLRDYGTGQWEGGDPDCDHQQLRGGVGEASAKQVTSAGASTTYQYRDVCGKCGATRIDQQLGLEPTPDLFVAAMVDVFREVRRVLRSDGSLWLNLGDSYNSGAQFNHDKPGARLEGGERYNEGTGTAEWPGHRPHAAGLKHKDLVGIPWRVAFALQADGWYLRSDIIWSKPNPMPESVTDRPTKAHEYVFLLTKSPRYFFDQEAVREPHTPDGRKVTQVVGGDGSIQHRDGERWPNGGRNVRSVWEIATQPYPEAHFATFPEALPERCIKAGTSERGCCPECGAPWQRETSTEYENPGNRTTNGPRSTHRDGMSREGFDVRLEKRVETTGWTPSCGCSWENEQDDRAPHNPMPCTVLDPFMGSGTTALVARRLGRRSVGVELNPEYAALCARRLQQLSLFGGEPEPVPSMPVSRPRGLTGGAYSPPGQSPHSNARPKK